MKKLLSSSCLFICLAISSCSGNSDKYSDPNTLVDGYGLRDMYKMWRSLDTDGSETFANKTIISENGEEIDGRSISTRKNFICSVGGFYKIDGMKEKYLVGKKLLSGNKLNMLGPYTSVGMFYDEVTPSSKDGKTIQYIDKKGNVVFDLNEVTGLSVRGACNYLGGLSIINVCNENNAPLYGAVNLKGELVLTPDYLMLMYIGNGLWYAVDKRKNQQDNPNEWNVDIIDEVGNVRFSFASNKYNINFRPNILRQYNFIFIGEYGAFLNNGGKEWDIFDCKGNVVLSSTSCNKILTGEHYGKYFVFKNEDNKEGIIDINGNIVAEAKYSDITYLRKDFFYGIIDKNTEVTHYDGNIVFSKEGKDLVPLCEGYSCYMKNFDVEFINHKGEVTNKYENVEEITYFDHEIIDFVVRVNP